MTHKNIFDDAFPQGRQVGGSHYKNFHIQPYEFISKNDLSFFQGNVVKYVCRYKNKNGIQDLEKIIHYCELEIKKLSEHLKKEGKIFITVPAFQYLFTNKDVVLGHYRRYSISQIKRTGSLCKIAKFIDS